MKKPVWKVTAIITLFAILIITLLSTNETYANETKLGEISVSAIINETGNVIISSAAQQSFGDYDIGTGFDNVQRVELRDTNGNVVKTLPHSSGTKYTIGTLTPTKEVKVTSKRLAKIDEGYFEWFRDPNLYVWMYDLDGKRTYRDTRWTVFDRPPADAKDASSVSDQKGTPLTGTGAVAWAKREGTLEAPPMVLEENQAVEVPFNVISGLKFSTSDFSLKSGWQLDTSRVTKIETRKLDPLTLQFEFVFEADYDLDYDQLVSNDTNGRVVRWYNEWEIGIEGHVYEYQKLYLWVVHNNSASPSPSTSTSPTPTPTPSSTPEPEPTLDGDFTIEKPSITVREGNKITPSVTLTGSCSFKELQWTFKQGAVTRETTRDKDPVYFNFTSFPGFSPGTIQVTMKIVTSCGTKTVGPKPFDVIADPSNHPPKVEVAWVKSAGSYKALDKATEGDELYFRVTSLTDPDGDDLSFQWDFSESSSWVRDLPAAYGWELPYTQTRSGKVKMSQVGEQTICGKAKDQWGAESEVACATVKVRSKFPIPVITGSRDVKVGRPLKEPLSSDASYSEVGHVIDHALDEWTNKKDVYDTPGTERVTLYVTDSAGLRSTYADSHKIEVYPDLPPEISVKYPSVLYRGLTGTITNNTFSPDADQIVETWVDWALDSNNDGNYDDEEQHRGISSLGSFTITPDKVGMIRLRAYGKEDYGLDASKDFYLKVDNAAPEVSYRASSLTYEPEADTPVSLTAAELASPAWKATSFNFLNQRKLWYKDASEGSIGTGKLYGSGNNYGSSTGSKYGLRPDGGTYSMYTMESPFSDFKYIEDFYYLGGDSYIVALSKMSTGVSDRFAIYKAGNVLNNSLSTNIISENGQTVFSWSEHLKVNRGKDLIATFGGTTNKDAHWNIYKLSEFRENNLTNRLAACKPDTITSSQNTYPSCANEPYWNELGNGNMGTTNTYMSLDTSNSSSFVSNLSVNPVVTSSYSCRDDDNKNRTCYVNDIQIQNKDYNGNVLWTSSIGSTTTMGSPNTSMTTYQSIDGNSTFVSLPNHALSAWLDLRNGANLATSRVPSGTEYKFETSTTTTEYLDDDGYPYYTTYYHHNIVKYMYGVKQWSKEIYSGNNVSPIGISAIGDDQAVYFLAATKGTDYYGNGTTIIANFHLNSADGSTLSGSPPAAWAEALPQLNKSFDVLDSSNKTQDGSIYKSFGSLTYNGGILTTTSASGAVLSSYDISSYINSGFIYSSFELVDDNKVVVYLGKGNGTRRTHISVLMLTTNPGNPATEPADDDLIEAGQLINEAQPDIAELNLSYKLKFNTLNNGESLDNSSAGFSFRIRDRLNMYRVETTPTKTYLYRIVGGYKTQLGVADYTMTAGAYTTFGIRTLEGNIKVKVNGYVLIDVNDGAFATGKIGPFSHRNFTELKDITYVAPAAPSTYYAKDAVLVNAVGPQALAYNVTYEDPENDPNIPDHRSWSVEHTDRFKFLDWGDGLNALSTLHGQTSNGETGPVTFDKVGLFKITYREQDDPSPTYRFPSGVFDSYRKYSNSYSRYINVHRIPISRYTLALNVDNTVRWTDTSYDVDRCYADLSCMPGFEANHGIFENKYYYITPSGDIIKGKLVVPTENGTYTVGMAVMDEFTAWSAFNVQTITIEGPLPPANHPPTVDIVTPGCTDPNSCTNFYTTTPTITWHQQDQDQNYFSHYRIQIYDMENGHAVFDSGEVYQNSWSTSGSMVVPAGKLELGKKYRVRMMVSDGLEWSEWSIYHYLCINSPPTVIITSPAGSKEVPTIIDSNKRPTISWLQQDKESNYFKKFYIEIADETSNPVYNTGWERYQETSSITNSFVVDADLPTGVLLQARMRVTDEDPGMWSEFSNTVWFKINFAPTAVMTFPNGTQANPTMGNPTPLITWTQTDPDPNTTFTKYRLLIRNEDATTAYVDETMQTHTTAAEGSYQVTNALPAGEKVRVTVMVWDNYNASSLWAAETWMLTNRPPVAEFDWMPKPVWEGDTVQLRNLSSDPDGNELTYKWEIRAPDGAVSTATSFEPSQTFAIEGDYTVKLTVSDGFEQDEVTHTIQAEPLTIQPDVEYTPEWLSNHEHKGHNTTVRPKDFYSGEIFVVVCVSAPAPVDEVEAWMDTTGKDGKSLTFSTRLLPVPGSDVEFRGELFDKRLQSMTEGLAEGTEPVHFRIRYSNGVVKEDTVPVHIIGSVYDYVGVHRVQ